MHILVRLLFPKICSMLTIKTADKTNDFNLVSLFLTLKKKYHIICRANHWIGFYVIGIYIMKEFRANFPI